MVSRGIALNICYKKLYNNMFIFSSEQYNCMCSSTLYIVIIRRESKSAWKLTLWKILNSLKQITMTLMTKTSDVCLYFNLHFFKGHNQALYERRKWRCLRIHRKWSYFRHAQDRLVAQDQLSQGSQRNGKRFNIRLLPSVYTAL